MAEAPNQMEYSGSNISQKKKKKDRPLIHYCLEWFPRRLLPRRKGSCRQECHSAQYPP